MNVERKSPGNEKLTAAQNIRKEVDEWAENMRREVQEWSNDLVARINKEKADIEKYISDFRGKGEDNGFKDFAGESSDGTDLLEFADGVGCKTKAVSSAGRKRRS